MKNKYINKNSCVHTPGCTSGARMFVTNKYIDIRTIQENRRVMNGNKYKTNIKKIKTKIFTSTIKYFFELSFFFFKTWNNNKLQIKIPPTHTHHHHLTNAHITKYVCLRLTRPCNHVLRQRSPSWCHRRNSLWIIFTSRSCPPSLHSQTRRRRRTNRQSSDHHLASPCNSRAHHHHHRGSYTCSSIHSHALAPRALRTVWNGHGVYLRLTIRSVDCVWQQRIMRHLFQKIKWNAAGDNNNAGHGTMPFGCEAERLERVRVCGVWWTWKCVVCNESVDWDFFVWSKNFCRKENGERKKRKWEGGRGGPAARSSFNGCSHYYEQMSADWFSTNYVLHRRAWFVGVGCQSICCGDETYQRDNSVV